MKIVAKIPVTEEYKNSLSLLCRQSAKVDMYIDMYKKRNKTVTKEVLLDNFFLLAEAKSDFLKEKEKLGFNDGLSFMDDCSFAGFSFQNGCLQGDYENLTKILIPWVEGDACDADHYRYEVGTLLLSHYFMKTEQYPGQSVRLPHFVIG